MAIVLNVVVWGQVDAQQPSPIRYYSLDNGSAKENINRKDGTIHGTVLPCPNRFGKEKAAMILMKNAYISTPNFFEGSTYSNGFTISFWTKIERDFPKRIATVPWVTTDSIYRLFYATNQAHEVMLGFYHRGDRAVIDRYVLNQSSDIANYGLWYWDPVNFTKRKGWYQVFLVYRPNNMSIYLMSPDARMESALHYFGMQSLTQATEWGLGWKNSPRQVLDDFKIYDKVLTEEDIKALCSRESVPNGMYTVTSAPNATYMWMSENADMAVGTLIDVYGPITSKEFSSQWVFEPSSSDPNVCKIRMAYTDRFLAGDDNTSASYAKLDFEYGNTDWIVEMTGDGYFFVRSKRNPKLYLKSAAKVFSSVRSLVTDEYKSADAPYYKWRLNLRKLHHDLVKDEFGNNEGYEIVENSNTAYGMVPIRPFVMASSPLEVNRDVYPSLSNHYKFKKGIDDSYYIYSVTYPTKLLYPQSPDFTDGSSVLLNEWKNGWETYMSFKVERPNPLGRRIRLIPIRSQTMSVYSGDYPTKDKITFKYFGQGLEDGHFWQVYRDDCQLNRNKQISTLTPGMYKIKSLMPGGRYLRPDAYSFNMGKELRLGSFVNERFTSFYWVVDYERDNHNNPIRDGSYLIRLMGTEALHIGSPLETISSGALAQLVELNRNQFTSSKWFIEPTRDGTGSFYLRSASGKLKFLLCESGNENAKVKYSYIHSQLDPNSYKWIFERVSVPAPLESGNYNILCDPYYVHTTNNSRADGTKLELGNLEQGGTYTWTLQRNDDNTYFIRLKDDNSKFIHTENYRVDASAPLVLGGYDARYTHAYRWLIEKTDLPDTYYLRIVGNHREGYMHLNSHHLLYGTRLEIYRYVDVVDPVYRWKLVKVK